jgi:hypothetical protein
MSIKDTPSYYRITFELSNCIGTASVERLCYVFCEQTEWSAYGVLSSESSEDNWHFGGTCRLHPQGLNIRWLMLDLIVDMLIRNDGWLWTNYTVLYPICPYLHTYTNVNLYTPIPWLICVYTSLTKQRTVPSDVTRCHDQPIAPIHCTSER